ncbi:MAG TPA: response regulator [Stellaceae bacterium]|jgi:CheY-like chemotaxis protein|nr:response regulator [Stellaceae bacterium]
MTAPKKSSAAILVVDDDEVMRDLLRRVLERSGFNVVTASDGRDGVESLRRHSVDVTITDIVMPVMDGIEMIRSLVTEQPDIRIIAVSGVDEWDNHLKTAQRLGAKAVLRKPVSSQELVSTVRRVLTAKK